MKYIILFFLMFLSVANAQDLSGVVQQAEIVKNESAKLSNELKKLNEPGAISISSLSFSDLIANIDTTIKKLGDLIDAAKKLTEQTSTQVEMTGNAIRESTVELTNLISIELTKLNSQLTSLIKSVDETVQSTNQTIQTVNRNIENVEKKANRVLNFVDSFGGMVVSKHFVEESGCQSASNIILWKRENRESDQFSYIKIGVDNIDESESREWTFLAGTNNGLFSYGAGYIQEGWGFNLGLNQFGSKGFDLETSLYRLNELGLNAELGYRPTFMKNSRMFLFGEDLLKDDLRTAGAGISYERGF